MNPGENPRRRALIQALETAQDTMKALPFEDKRRAELSRRIVQIEDALDAEMEP